jgi:flagellar hook-associated protein 3 FlgL
MRVANKTLYDSSIRNLNITSSGLFDANETVSTAKKINSLSDDPVGLVAVLGLRSSISNLDQMERNISMGNSWLNASESALTQVNNILSSTKELTVTLSSATVNASQREENIDLVDGYLQEIISLSNSSSDGRYIFGGTNTGTIPFAMDAAGTQVSYSGNDTAFSINIGRDSVVPVGRDGKDVFGANWDDSNIFKTFVDLKTSLANNDVDGIRDSMTKLDAHVKNVNAQVSDIAGKTIRLNVKTDVIADLKITDTERMSKLEDADLAEAIMNLQSKELAYNAALSSSSKLMKLSLVNYL